MGVPVVECDDLPAGRLGYYDAETGRVVVRADLSLAVRRSTLGHELFHVLAGDAYPRTWWGGVASELSEDDADELAARHLVPLLALVTVLASAETAEEAADALGVDVDTLATRMRTLTPAEARHLRRRTMPTVLPAQRLATP